MWIIHRGNRNSIYNVDMYESVEIQNRFILLSNKRVEIDNPRELSYSTDAEAQQAFSYLMEGIKRGDKLIHI